MDHRLVESWGNVGSAAVRAPADGLVLGATRLMVQAGFFAVASRRPEDLQIQILGDRRGAGAELIGEQGAAALEHS